MSLRFETHYRKSTQSYGTRFIFYNNLLLTGYPNYTLYKMLQDA